MRIAVMGAGGVGGYFGARLAAAGHDVLFVARGAHARAIAEDGLRVHSANGDLHIRRAQVTEDPSGAAPADIVLFCVKLWDTGTAARQLRPLVGAGTGVISLQNGVDKEAALVEALGRPHVMGGVAQIGAAIECPGVIRHTGTMAKLIYGELGGRRSARVEAFHDAVSGAGIDGELTDDVELAIWEKFSFLAPFAGATTYFAEPIGPVREDPARRRLLVDLVREAVAVGRARGVRLADEREEQVMAFVAGLPAEMKSSMLVDFEAGRRLELEWLTGAVVRLGAEAGVPTPESARVLETLRPYAEGRD